MMPQWIHKLAIVLMLICFSSQPSISFAGIGNDLKQQAFSNFEKKIFDLIDSSMKPLNKFDGELDKGLDEESLFKIILSAKQKFAESSHEISKLKVPNSLPEDLKVSLEQIKGEFYIGFKALEESMNYFAQYMESYNPLLFDTFIEERNKGFLYIDGGLTSLATIRLQVDAPRIRPIPNAWKVGKRLLYQLPMNIPVNDKVVLILQDDGIIEN